MAPDVDSLTTKVESDSPYQLDMAQVNRATTALVDHINAHKRRKEASAEKKNLLAADSSDSDEDGVAEEDDTAIWLTLTTKKHISDQKRLKPGKIALPHSLHTSPTARVCLITADPQRTFKDIVSSPSFPSTLAPRISRVIGLTKLKARYKSYESRRQLLSEHDVFLADDRIITFLPKMLGKIFYRSGSKRPVPVFLTAGAPRDMTKKDKSVPKNPLPPRKTGPREGKHVGGPAEIGREIEKALGSALIHLSPSTTTSVKVARGRWAPEKLAANVEAVVNGMVEKYVPRGWRNVRSIHVKGNETAALPIWLASELWEDEADVLEEGQVEKEKKKSVRKVGSKKERLSIKQGKTGEKQGKTDEKQGKTGEKQGKKRKSSGDGKGVGKEREGKRRKGEGEGEKDKMAVLSAERKERLKKQKAVAMADAA